MIYYSGQIDSTFVYFLPRLDLDSNMDALGLFCSLREKQLNKILDPHKNYSFITPTKTFEVKFCIEKCYG